MRVHVAFVPSEAASAPFGIVVDVLRATSTIAQALATGYGRRCEEVLLGSLLNLAALTEAARQREKDVAIVCAGYEGAFAAPAGSSGCIAFLPRRAFSAWLPASRG